MSPLCARAHIAEKERANPIPARRLDLAEPPRKPPGIVDDFGEVAKVKVGFVPIELVAGLAGVAAENELEVRRVGFLGRVDELDDPVALGQHREAFGRPDAEAEGQGRVQGAVSQRSRLSLSTAADAQRLDLEVSLDAVLQAAERGEVIQRKRSRGHEGDTGTHLASTLANSTAVARTACDDRFLSLSGLKRRPR